jgi:hypothetical protein
LKSIAQIRVGRCLRDDAGPPPPQHIRPEHYHTAQSAASSCQHGSVLSMASPSPSSSLPPPFPPFPLSPSPTRAWAHSRCLTSGESTQGLRQPTIPILAASPSNTTCVEHSRDQTAPTCRVCSRCCGQPCGQPREQHRPPDPDALPPQWGWPSRPAMWSKLELSGQASLHRISLK